MSAHDLELICPLYGTRGTHTAFCTCGWASGEEPTAARATIVGWAHVHANRQAKAEPERLAS